MCTVPSRELRVHGTAELLCESFANLNIESAPGEELILGSNHRGARWDGQRFTLMHSAALAA